MKKYTTSSKIYIADSKIKKAGRGVFASKEIKKGEVIEICPIILLPKNDLSNLNGSMLMEYFFYLGKEKNQIAIVLGFGSIYNHSIKPNSKYKIFIKEKIIKFTAIENIKKEIEITFNYKGYNSKIKNPLWFETD